MVTVDKSRCISCGLCANICGEVFEIGIDGKSFVKENKDLPCVKEAIEECPVAAIIE